MSESDDHTRRAGRLLRPLLLATGAAHLALGAVMAIGPRGFYDAIAAYPPYNDHFLRDLSSFYLALGAVLIVAAARRSWQVPVLVLAFVQYVLHTLVHLLDVGDADPGWVGPVNLVSLAATSAFLLWLLRGAQAAGRR